MRRTVLVPTMVTAALQARAVLAAMSFALLLVLAWTLATPVAAQQEETTAQTTVETPDASKDKDASGQREQSVQGSGQQAGEGEAQAVDLLEGQTANIEDKDGDETPDSIGPIAVAGCEASEDATPSITVADDADAADATEEVFTDGDGVVFRFGQQGITITAEEGGDLAEDADFKVGTGVVIDSSGITCGRDAGEAAVGDDGGNSAETEDLANLGCDELLVLFRGDGGQYRDESAFADPAVRAQVEVCLEQEIVQGTAADEDLPETGGLSLIGLAVLGVATAAAGLSVIRGGRR